MTVWNRSRRGSARRGLAITATSALLAALLIPGIAFGEHRENTTELEAADEVGAALEWSSLFDSASSVAIGRDDLFADNLASGLIQGLGDGVPLLLTPTDALDADVADEIERLGATAAHILGGESAISADVEDELKDMGLTIHRHAGASRVETAVDIASKHGASATTAIVARAFASGADATQAFADSLAAGAWAAEAGYPILLTQTNELHSAVANHLAASDVEDVFVVGGTSAVSANVVSQIEALGIDVTRVSGPTRFDTAVEIANARGFDDSSDATDGVILVDGQSSDAWADGFAAAAFASNPKPIVLSNSAADELPQATQDFLVPGEVDLICGSSVPDDDCDDAAEELGHELIPDTNETLALTPDTTETKTISASAPNDNRGARTYTITGLDNTKTYDVALFPAANVSVDGDGVVSLTDTTPDNSIADLTVDTAGGVIEVVNGAAVTTPDNHVEVQPVNGQITFTIDATTADQVIPVIWVDAETADDDALDLNADNTPSEAFGIGGRTNWIPTELAAGAFDGKVVSVNKDAGYFIIDVDTTADSAADADAVVDNDPDSTVNYASGDNWQREINGAGNPPGDEAATGTCVSTTEANWASNLSVGDFISGIYSQDASSTLCLDDAAPGSPTGVSAVASGNDVTVTWTGVTGADSYNIYRAADPSTANACPEDGGTADITASNYAKVGSVPSTATTFKDANVANGTYCYTVTAVAQGDESAVAAGASDEAQVTTPVADTTAPNAVANASVVDTDTGFNNVPDTGDVFRIFFTEAVVLNNPALMVADGDGDTDTIDSSNATFTVDGSVLTVTLTANLADDATGTGTNNGLSLPLTIVNDRGIADAAGNRSTFTGDALLEDDGPEFYTETCDAGETTCTVVFNEALTKAPAETPANYTFVDASAGGVTITGASLGADGRTVTLTFSGALGAGDTIDPAAAITDTEGEAATQGATAIA